jgi:phospholipase C
MKVCTPFAFAPGMTSTPRFAPAVLAFLLATSAVAAPRARVAKVPKPLYPVNVHHVVVIVLENETAKNAAVQPYLAELAQRGASLTNYHAITHPSRPNYIAMFAGDTYGVTSDSSVTVAAAHLGDLLEERGATWRVYAENYPGNCFLGSSTPDGYVRRHTAFLDYKNVQEDPRRCRYVVDASRFAADVATGGLPSFALYVPNNVHNGHDTDVSTADTWLRGWLDPYLSDPRLATTLFVVTFDEARTTDPTNIIYTALVGAGVRHGAVSNQLYGPYSLLRTIEEIFGTGSLHKGDAAALPIRDVWR